jgi:hypothetical protein
MLEKVNFSGWANSIKLSNREIEMIILTDVGPRIISLGYKNSQNLFYVSPSEKGKTGGEQWHLYGGHRLWHSPEEMPRSYGPDNNKVEHSWDGKTLTLSQEKEPLTGLIKEMEITMETVRNSVKVLHRIINKNLWAIKLSPWAITAFAGGGTAILPQEPYVDPERILLPARPLVLWYYTRMDDPRWVWGQKYIQMNFDPALKSEQKIGILNKQGWAAYYLNGELFIKIFEYDESARYPDYECNNELYMNGYFVEVESLGPFEEIPSHGMVEHIEYWTLNKIPVLKGEDSIDRNVLPVVKSIQHSISWK